MPYLSSASIRKRHVAMQLQEVEDLERQLRLLSDSAAAVATANGLRQLTLNDKGRSNKISAQSIARKVHTTSMQPNIVSVQPSTASDVTQRHKERCPKPQSSSLLVDLVSAQPNTASEVGARHKNRGARPPQAALWWLILYLLSLVLLLMLHKGSNKQTYIHGTPRDLPCMCLL